MAAGLDLLDDIGLALSVIVLVFISYFHFRGTFSGRVSEDTRSWDRRMGAWLVIWLLLYFILIRLRSMSDFFVFEQWDSEGHWAIEYVLYSFSSTLNFQLIHLFLMLLVPIPFLRNKWQLGGLVAIAILAILLDHVAEERGTTYNHATLLTVCLTMTAALVVSTVALRFLMFPPDDEATDENSLAMRRSGYFALGTICVVMDNMIFRVLGYFRGTGNTWWTFPTVNWSVETFGFLGSMISMVEIVFIIGAFAYCMLAFAIGGIFHLIQVARKKHSAGLPTAFSVYMLFIWTLIIFRQWAYETEYANWNMVEQPLDYTGEVINALSDGFTFHLIYPTIAMLHAVKFGLIEIESEQDKKILRIIALMLMVAIAAIFTEILQEIINISDIAFAIFCGLILATGWEKKLINALEPNEEMMKYSWNWPGDSGRLILGINLVVGVSFLLSLALGVMY